MNLAARRYLHGDTLADIAARLHVSPTSLTRELRLASIPIRPRGRRTSGEISLTLGIEKTTLLHQPPARCVHPRTESRTQVRKVV